MGTQSRFVERVVDGQTAARCLRQYARSRPLEHSNLVYWGYVLTNAAMLLFVSVVEIRLLARVPLFTPRGIACALSYFGLAATFSHSILIVSKEVRIDEDQLTLVFLKLWKRNVPLSAVHHVELMVKPRFAKFLFHFSRGERWAVYRYRAPNDGFGQCIAHTGNRST